MKTKLRLYFDSDKKLELEINDGLSEGADTRHIIDATSFMESDCEVFFQAIQALTEEFEHVTDPYQAIAVEG